MMWTLFLAGLALFVLVAPFVLIVTVSRLRRELRMLSERLGWLEERVARQGATLTAVPQPGVEPAPPPEPIPFPGIAPTARDVAEAVAPTPTPSPTAIPPAAGSAIGAAERWAAAASRPAKAEPAGHGFDSSRAEQMIGSIWLQNAGSVLLLLGVFFLILWGYTTGRFGPGVLVAAGVVLGITLAWRGDRVARSLPGFGHALIGVGLGTIYLSLYLGHFTLRVLPPAAAFTALVLVSIGSIAVGLRYRVQSIAALGVLGAFLPQFMAAWIPLKGFTMSAPSLLGYFAAVDVVVFLLAARAGWSGLDLACLFLTAVTWIAQLSSASWGLGVQAGLTALFTALGLSPLPRLISREGAVRAIDLLVITLAPMCLIAASWPWLLLDRGATAALLITLAVVYLLAALWVDGRRSERDLWMPLTGAAVMFLTAALERALAEQLTPMAWCVEGTVLLWLGLRPRGAWLRVCGYAVSVLGALATLFHLSGWQHDQLPAFYAGGIRDLVCILAVLAGAWLLARGRAHLGEGEGVAPELWTAFGNLMLLAWTGREAVHLGMALEGEGGRWAHPRDLAAPTGNQRLQALIVSLIGFVWAIQSAVLVGIGRRPGRGFLRACGYGVWGLAISLALVALNLPDGWSRDQRPVLHPTGLITLGSIVLIAAMAWALARRRDRLDPRERLMPEVMTLGASLLMLGWTALEADHLARWIQGLPGVWARHVPGVDPAVRGRARVLAATFTSAGWLAQALVLLVLGWTRRSAFLRWAGLGLTGITVLKFLLVDLQAVDVFWRFLTAIVVGAALLAISYAYQRRARG